MATVVAVEHLSLDGVYQGPARPDEDTRDGFDQGGWTAAGDDPAMQQAIGEVMGRSWSLLVGHTTYDDLHGHWSQQPGDPMADALEAVTKFVVSTSFDQPPPWPNTHVLGDLDAVEQLKQEQEQDTALVIFGSGELVRSLMDRDLVDSFLLMVHPVVLGAGRRLFTDDCPATRLQLVGSRATDTGVLIATYRSAPPPADG